MPTKAQKLALLLKPFNDIPCKCKGDYICARCKEIEKVVYRHLTEEK